MGRRGWIPAFAGMTAFLASFHLHAAFELSGYAKSLNFLSPARESEGAKGLSGNRLRLDGFWKDPKASLSARMIADTEFLIGSLLDSQREAVSRQLAKEELLDLNSDISEKDNFLARENLYRAYAEGHWGSLDAIAGRQRVAWAQGRLWNPTDVINPYNPLSVERQERPGSDLLKLRWNFSALNFLEAVYAPKRGADWPKSVLLGRLRANFLQTDLGILGGRRGRENMIGAELAAQVFEGSLRSEAAYGFDSSARRDFSKAVFSYDRSFSLPNTLYLLGEYYYNGIGERDKMDYRQAVLLPTDQAFVGRDYFGLGSSYDLTPLWKLECYGIFNLNDGSAYVGPRLLWEAAADLDLEAGYQVFTGRAGSEFGDLRDIGFFQLQWFFNFRLF